MCHYCTDLLGEIVYILGDQVKLTCATFSTQDLLLPTFSSHRDMSCKFRSIYNTSEGWQVASKLINIIITMIRNFKAYDVHHTE